MQKLTKESVDLMNLISDKSFNLHFDFLKKILTVSATVFAVMVSLSPLQMTMNNDCSMIQNLLFLIAVTLLALGILGVGICLYSFVLMMRYQADHHSRLLSRRAWGKESDRPADKRPSIVYTIFGQIGFVCLLSSVVVFVGYIIAMTLNK